jgi:ElaB/YqjD/DUF883 family membrane-anchored ribosome-binding protein
MAVARLTQINGVARQLAYSSPGQTTKAHAMFDSSGLRDELQALKVDVSALLNTTAEGLFDASKSRADALADQIKAALSELGETMGGEQDHVEKLIAERPITTLASAFALGVVVGFMLRRH